MAGNEQDNDLLADLDAFLTEHEAELIEFRRDLHMHPELAFNEHRTTRRVALRLAAAGLRPVILPKGTGMLVDIGSEQVPYTERPVVALRAFDTLDEAMVIADDTEYGLAVSLVTNHLPSVIRFARETRHGIVKVNSPTTGVSLNAPFGGFKHSSNQAAKEQGGATVMDFYTRIKTVYLGG